MDIKIIPDTQMGENTYVLTKEDECLIIDPGSEEEEILKTIHSLIAGKRLRGVIYTHCHFDHIRGGRYFNIDQYMSEKEIEELPIQSARARSFWGIELKEPQNLKILLEHMTLGKFDFKVLETPGHTKGGVCFYFEKENVLFTGDTLFKGNYGRTDIGGDDETMRTSLKELAKMDLKIVIFPGHGEPSTIGDEKVWIDKI